MNTYAQQQFERRERHLMRSIEHCLSVVSLCRLGGSTNAQLAYEQRLVAHTEELAQLRADWESINEIVAE